MKKFILGLIVGLFVAIGSTAYADDVSEWIGKMVEGEATIKIDGNTFTGIVVDGRSFVSVRELADKLGYNIDYADGGYVLDRDITIEYTKDDVPYIHFKNDEEWTQMILLESLFQIGTSQDAILYPENDLRLTPHRDIRLSPYTGDVYVPNWGRLIESESQKSLREELDELREMINELR